MTPECAFLSKTFLAINSINHYVCVEGAGGTRRSQFIRSFALGAQNNVNRAQEMCTRVRYAIIHFLVTTAIYTAATTPVTRLAKLENSGEEDYAFRFPTGVVRASFREVSDVPIYFVENETTRKAKRILLEKQSTPSPSAADPIGDTAPRCKGYVPGKRWNGPLGPRACPEGGERWKSS